MTKDSTDIVRAEAVETSVVELPQDAEIPYEKLDPDALKVVLRLKERGHQVYLVGGCVRDLLIGRSPKDFDIATSAHPGEVRATFRNCRLIGRRFRLAHVYFRGGKICEVSTFRANPTELIEEAPAHPEVQGAEEAAEEEQEGDDLLITQDNVFGTEEQDARRRDFTINGLFYDVKAGRVIDYVRGRRDLALREIRTIGDPEVRLREDPVRILRAVRFACKLDFDIESRTYAAMEGAVEDLPRCAAPRLLEETFRLFRAGIVAQSIHLLRALDALKYLLPPLNDYLNQAGKEGEESFNRFARALDSRILAGATFDDAILLATMLVPLSRAQPTAEESSPAGRPMVAQAVEDLLGDFVRTSRLPKRIAERCRLILLAQSTLAGDKRRRRSLASFKRHPLFNEALTVFEMGVEATGEGREMLEIWKSGGVPKLPPETGEGSEGQGEGLPRRRRRRRRKRPGPPGTNGLPPPPSES